MTPMVDVVFQLMTFMLFTVQMTGGEKVDVPPARHGVGVEESGATFLTLTKPSTPGGEPRLLLGHGEGAAAHAGSGAQGGRGRRSSRAGRKVIIQADSEVPHGEVLKVAGAVAQVEGITVHLGVQEATGTLTGGSNGSEGALASWDVFHADSLELERGLSTDAVRAAVAGGTLRDDDLVRPSGTTVSWARLGDLPELTGPDAADGPEGR